ncbi:MAG: DUF6382 domain-containing protein [Schaedlerella sp.]|nr:DUF6382 domain-containing protein [Schaedlerella sp.]
MRIEYETNLNHENMHIFTEEPYEEDYQIQMIRQNKIEGVLAVEGCEIEGKSRYTYEISGFASMKKIYEKKVMKKEELKSFVEELLSISDRIQKFLLEPNSLVLDPECIFRKSGKWNFCYLPGKKKEIKQQFHQLSEYFVKTIDYKDTASILLAYELHKASFQEHYNLRQIIEEYEKNGEKREKELKELKRKQKLHENIFSLDEDHEKNVKAKKQGEFVYNPTPVSAAIHETQGPWQYRVRKKVQRNPLKKRWGIWEDLLAESED